MVTRDDPLRPTYEQNESTHPNEDLNHRHHRDAPVVISPPCSIFEYPERFLICFVGGCFCCAWTDKNKLQERDSLSECFYTAFPGWTKRRNHWIGCCALSCRCIVKETYSPFVRCRKEGDYERRLFQFLACMRDQGDRLADKPNLGNFVLSLRFDGL